jgi:hypothetical protein
VLRSVAPTHHCTIRIIIPRAYEPAPVQTGGTLPQHCATSHLTVISTERSERRDLLQITPAEGRFLKVGWAVPTDLMIKGKKLVTQSVLLSSFSRRRHGDAHNAALLLVLQSVRTDLFTPALRSCVIQADPNRGLPQHCAKTPIFLVCGLP